MNLRTVVQWIAFDLRGAAWDWLVNTVAGSSLMPRVGRALVYRAVGIRTLSLALAPGIFFQSSRVRIGRTSFINRGVRFFCSRASIDIGDRVQVAMGVTFVTDTHPVGGPEQRCSSDVTSLPIRIGDGCWIGANATILPGVVIGRGCVIAAGAVVIRNCEEGYLFAGVPARRLKKLPGPNIELSLTEELSKRGKDL